MNLGKLLIFICPYLFNVFGIIAKAYIYVTLLVSRKLWTVYEKVSCMQQLRERYASRTCYYARASLWCQRQELNYAQSQPTVSSTLMHRF